MNEECSKRCIGKTKEHTPVQFHIWVTMAMYMHESILYAVNQHQNQPENYSTIENLRKQSPRNKSQSELMFKMWICACSAQASHLVDNNLIRKKEQGLPKLEHKRISRNPHLSISAASSKHRLH
uniref:Uncharacterized protein n=1 Tax=Rhizophora mucronata TaxID=61149 RepID=A0A2P2LS37_RHIMU